MVHTDGLVTDLSSTRIIIVSLYYWPEPAGSAPPVQQMAEALARLGSRVTVLTARPAYPEMRVYPEYRDGARDCEQYNGIDIERIPIGSCKPGDGILSRLTTELNFALRVWWKLLGISHYTHLISLSPSILAVLAGIFGSFRPTRRTAIVHDLQSGLALSLKMSRYGFVLSMLEWLERTTLNRLDHVITLSESMAETLKAIGVISPITIIPPTVDDDFISPQPEPSGPVTAIYSGNLGRKQGLSQLLDLAVFIENRDLAISLIIRGDGNYREKLKQRAEELGLRKLRIEPLRRTEELSDALAEGHIYLVPQDPAGAPFAMPSKIYSIMAAGRPFICTAEVASPLDKLRKSSDAFVICKPNDPVHFGIALEILMMNSAERLRLGMNGRDYVKKYAGKTACERAYGALVSSQSIITVRNDHRGRSRP